MSAIRSLWLSTRERVAVFSKPSPRGSVMVGALVLAVLASVILSDADDASGPVGDVGSGGPAGPAGTALNSVRSAGSGIDSSDPQQRVLVPFLAKRFRVAHDAVGTFVAAAFRAGTEHRVDPLLVLAVVAVESRFNPVAESALGAKGLMQVLPKYHQDKLAAHGGDAALLDPVVNIDVGTRILREYLRRGGDLRSGLKLYSGGDDEFLAQYAGKVLSERARMEALLSRQRKVGI